MSKDKNSKRRYNSAKIAKTPALKKKLALFIAENEIENKNHSIVEMLAYGNRGYISYDEKELCKLFDAVFSSLLEKEKNLLKHLEENKINKHFHFMISDIEQRLNNLRNGRLRQAKEIANEIFEKEILGV